MDANFRLEQIDCPVCSSPDYKKLGIRGNREYSGANPNATPHIKTDVVRCSNCQFIYTNPMIRGMEHLEEEHYNNADVYQSTAENGEEMFKHRLDFIRKFKGSGNLLDIGAGKGEFLGFAKDVFNAEGVEPSKAFCNYGSEKYGVTMYPGYLSTNEDVKGNKYDVITMLHVLEHVNNPNELIPGIKEYLNDEGILVIEVPNTNSTFLRIIDLFYRLKGLNWSSRLSPLHPPFHIFGYNPPSLKYLLEKHGYSILTLETYSGKDRGFEKKAGVSKVLFAIRNIVSSLINVLGNRELLFVIAKKNG